MSLAGAGAVQTVISSPVELLKIRLQLQTSMPGSPSYVGSYGMLQRIISTEGMTGNTQCHHHTGAEHSRLIWAQLAAYIHTLPTATLHGLLRLPGAQLSVLMVESFCLCH